MNQLEGGPFTYQLNDDAGNLLDSLNDSDALGGNIIFDGLEAQDYVLEIWNINFLSSQDEDCKTISEITLTQPDELIINSISAIDFSCGYNVSCNGASDGIINVDVIGGCGGSYNYSWDLIEMDENENITAMTGLNNPLGVNSPIMENVGAGQYLVTVFDGYCSESTTIILTEPDELIINTTQTNINCYGGNDGFVSVNISGGCSTEPYIIEWLNENGEVLELTPITNTLESGAVISSVSGLTEGYYEVNITDSNGCINNDGNFTITEPEQALFVLENIYDYNGFGISCNGANDGEINLDINGGTPPYIITWTDENDNFISNEQNLINLNPGEYILST